MIHKDKSNEYYYTFGISQKVILYNPKENKFLLVKIKSEKNPFFQKCGPWELIGGTLNPGEDLEKSLDREIKEEMGKIEYKNLCLVASEKIIRNDGKEKIVLGNLAEFIGGEIKLSKEHSEYKWESYENIIEGLEYKPWLKNFISKAQKYIESEEYLNGWKRCQADFENYRKVQAEAQKDLIKYSTENVIMQIIPVLDNFHMSTDHIPEDQKDGGWVVGIMHIQKQLENVLADNGVEEIAPKIGDEFDPMIHEAIEGSDQESVTSDQKNEKQELIKKVLMKGYKMGEKVIRPAKVIVN